MEVEANDPQLIIKATITSDKRNTVDIVMGYSPERSASAPVDTIRIPWVFNKSGGEYPMMGDGKSSTMSVTLDASEMIPFFTDERGTVFLQAEGEAVINHYSVTYYGTDTPRVFTYAGTPVDIYSKVNLGVNIDLRDIIVDNTSIVKNYPNPFNGSTNIDYELLDEGKVRITVYNAKGNKVRTLINGTQEYGAYTVTWDGKDDHSNQVSSGIYYVVLEVNGQRQVNKMVLLK